MAQLPVPEGVDEDRNNDPLVNPSPLEPDKLAGKDGGEEGRKLASYWLQQVQEVDEDKEQKRWLKRGTQIEKRYRDERNRTDEDGQRRYNALWANVQILIPALYGKVPVPIVERRFKDKDPTGRGASSILERALRNEIEVCGYDEAMQQAVQEYLLPGRGTVWVRYEPELEPGFSIPPDAEMDVSDDFGDLEEEDNSEEETKLRETGDRIVRESTPVDFIQWTDFYTFPSRARTWSEVVAVGKRVYMTRDQMKRRFGDEIGRAIPLQKDDRHMRRQEDTSDGHEREQKAQVYEIWSRSDEAVYWVAEGYQHLCDRKDDPLKLEKFFPTPRPLFANPTTNTLVPVPDFIQYQDQAIQIDELTQRISMLAKACKVAGVYNAAAKSIQRLFNESVENELIPVDDWTAFAEKGGVEGNLSFIPLKEIMGVLQELQQVRAQAIEDMDRLTGINDVMQGTTDARETEGAQRLKSNATGTRLQRRQNEVARFARDTLRIMADIMCQHFSPQSLIEVSGAMYEEGLGTMDIPSLTALQQQLPPSPGAPGPPPGAAPATGGAPGGGGSATTQASTGAPPFSPPGGPQMPTGAPSGGQGVMPPLGPQGGQQPSGVPMAQPQMPPPVDPQLLDKMQGLQRIATAIELLRNQRLRGFRVDIEVDSTIYGDQQQDKQDRTAFIAAVTGFMEQYIQITMQLPDAAPLLGKFLQFGTRGFPIGRDLEQAIEDFSDAAAQTMKQKAAQAQQQPNPEQMKAQAALMGAQAKMADTQTKVQQTQSKIQGDQMAAQQKARAAAAQLQSDQMQAQAEIERQKIENEGEQRNAEQQTLQSQMDLEMQKIQLQIELKKLEIEEMKARAAMQQSHVDMAKSGLDMQKSAMDAHASQEKSEAEIEKSRMDMKSAKLDHQHEIKSSKMDMEHQKVTHEQALEKGELDIKKAKASANKPKPTGSK